MAEANCENLIVITVENLHTGLLGCYGNSTVDTEHLDMLAAEGLVFDNYYAGVPTCEAVRGAIFGLTLSALSEQVSAWAALSQQLVWIGPQRFLERDQSLLDRIFKQAVAIEEPARPDHIVAAAAEWLSEYHRQGPFLLWLEVPGLEPPREVPDEWRELYEKELGGAEADEESTVTTFQQMEAQGLAGQPIEEEELEGYRILWGALVDRPEMLVYAAGVTWVDDAIGSLLSALRDSVLWPKTGVIVTSDHGERILTADDAQGDDYDPGPLHEEILHLPLIVRLPGMHQRVGRSRALLTPEDLGTGIIDLLAAGSGNEEPSRLRAILEARAEPTREAILCRAPDGTIWGLRTREWFFLTRLNPEAPPEFRDELDKEEQVLQASRLYAKPEDRWERNSLHRAEPAVCIELFDRLIELLQQHRPYA